MRQLAFWVVLFLVLLLSFQRWMTGKTTPEKITYSQFTREVDGGNIKELTFVDKEVHGEFAEPRELTVGLSRKSVKAFKLILPFPDPALVTRVQEHNPDAILGAERAQGNWFGYVFSGLPILLLFLVWLFIFRQMQGGGNRAFSFGKSTRQVAGWRPSEGHLRGRRRRRRGQAGAAGNRRVPARPEEVPAPGRPHPEGRAAARPARDRQDAAGARRSPARPGYRSSA